MEVCQELSKRDLIPAGSTRLWIRGEWIDTEMFGFEISNEPVEKGYAPEVNDRVEEALRLLRRGKGQRAEQLMREALELESEQPDLLNNLAAAISAQGRHDEAMEMIRDVHARWPDYFFGRTGMAQWCLGNKDYEGAEAYLTPLRKLRRMHISEFMSLASAYVRLNLLLDNDEEALHWHEMAEQIDPDHPTVKQRQGLFAVKKIQQRWSNLRR